jgi:hypothetical protein
MKFAVTKYEQFALTSHLVGLPSPNPEYARKRLRAWDELGVADLADALACGATGVGADINLADWRDRKTPHLIDVSEDIMVHLIAALSGPLAGVWSDTLTRVRERLERLRDKVYELPPELRTLKTVAE